MCLKAKSFFANLIKKSEPVGKSLEDRLKQANLLYNPFLIWRIKVMARQLCI